MTDRIDTGDGEIAWTRYGEGPPLLLVNGYAATGADWDPAFIAGLAEAFDVLCPDNRGMGGSDLGAGPMTVDRLVEDLVDLLDALEIERAAVAGWSMGGFVAQALAAAHPSRVGGLVLLATAAAGPGSVSADPAVTARLFDHSGTPREQASRLIGLLFPEGIAEEIDAEFGEGRSLARGPRGAGGADTPLAPRAGRLEPGGDRRADTGYGRGRGRGHPARERDDPRLFHSRCAAGAILWRGPRLHRPGGAARVWVDSRVPRRLLTGSSEAG